MQGLDVWIQSDGICTTSRRDFFARVEPVELQTFITEVGKRVNRRKTTENIYITLSSILNNGRKWGYLIPESKRSDLEFPADRK